MCPRNFTGASREVIHSVTANPGSSGVHHPGEISCFSERHCSFESRTRVCGHKNGILVWQVVWLAVILGKSI